MGGVLVLVVLFLLLDVGLVVFSRDVVDCPGSDVCRGGGQRRRSSSGDLLDMLGVYTITTREGSFKVRVCYIFRMFDPGGCQGQQGAFRGWDTSYESQFAITRSTDWSRSQDVQ